MHSNDQFMTIQLRVAKVIYGDLIVGSEKKEQKRLNIDEVRSTHLKPCHIQFQEHCGLKFGDDY